MVLVFLHGRNYPGGRGMDKEITVYLHPGVLHSSENKLTGTVTAEEGSKTKECRQCGAFSKIQKQAELSGLHTW